MNFIKACKNFMMDMMGMEMQMQSMCSSFAYNQIPEHHICMDNS